MNVYVSTDFEGHYPVGTSALVVAHDEADALRLLADALKEHGLKGDSFSVDPFPLEYGRALVLQDGNY